MSQLTGKDCVEDAWPFRHDRLSLTHTGILSVDDAQLEHPIDVIPRVFQSYRAASRAVRYEMATAISESFEERPKVFRIRYHSLILKDVLLVHVVQDKGVLRE